MSGPLIGFHRNSRHSTLVDRVESSRNLQIGIPPNQAYLWSLPGIPARTYFAMPLADASNQVHQIVGPFDGSSQSTARCKG